MNIFKFFKGREWIFSFLVLGLIIFQVWLDLELPGYMNQMTVMIKSGVCTTTDIIIIGLKMLGVSLIISILSIIVGYFAATISATISKRMRTAVFDKVQNFGHNEISKFSIPSLITRSTNDITQIQMLVAMGLEVLLRAPILSIWAIATILGKSWTLSLATAGAVLLLVILVVVIIVFALPKFKKIQTLTDNLNRVTRENISGLRVVRAHNAENFESKKFAKANNELTNTNLAVNRLMSLLSPGMTLMTSGLSLAIYWIGAILINSTALSATGDLSRIVIFGDIMVFMQYSMMIVMSFVMLTMIFIMLPRAMVSSRRIGEVLNTQNIVKYPEKSTKNTNFSPFSVEFRNVSFRYPGADEYVLKDINFTALPGQTIAFVGSTGSGKSTLLNLIPRFYDATEGNILINGNDVKNYSKKDLLNIISYVSQKAFLFDDTIQNNITFGNNGKQKTIEIINSALKISQSTEFVQNMPQGIDSHISQGGQNLSGGQKQRLSIARALAREPQIILFDDSFSALDYKTDKILREELKNNLKNTTILIVAQRIGTIMDADTIIVLDEGKMVGMGKHNELIQSCAVYKEIALSQLSEEEL